MKTTKRTKNSHYESAPTIKAPVLPPLTPEEIHLRAHQIYMSRGGIPGRELEDWLLAEYQLKRERDQPEIVQATEPGRIAAKSNHGASKT